MVFSGLDRGAATFYNHGTMLKALRRPQEALRALDKALAIDPADPETWNNRGAVLNDLARFEEAIGDFDSREQAEEIYARITGDRYAG